MEKEFESNIDDEEKKVERKPVRILCSLTLSIFLHLS
jgi:hypothetical protein